MCPRRLAGLSAGSYLFLFRLEHVRVLQERKKPGIVVDSYATKIQYVVANAFRAPIWWKPCCGRGGPISEFSPYAEELVKMHPSTININLAPAASLPKYTRLSATRRPSGTICSPTPSVPARRCWRGIRARPPLPARSI